MAFLLLFQFFPYENALNIFVHEFHAKWGRISLGHTPGTRIAALSVVRFTRPSFQHGCISLYPHQQCGRMVCAPVAFHIAWGLRLFCLWSQDGLWLSAFASCMPFLSYTPRLILFLDCSTKSTHTKIFMALEDSPEDTEERFFSVAIVQTHSTKAVDILHLNMSFLPQSQKVQCLALPVLASNFSFLFAFVFFFLFFSLFFSTAWDCFDLGIGKAYQTHQLRAPTE